MQTSPLLQLPEPVLHHIWTMLGGLQSWGLNHRQSESQHALHCTCRDMRMLTRYVRRMHVSYGYHNAESVDSCLRAFPKHAELHELIVDCASSEGFSLGSMLGVCAAANDALVKRRLASIQLVRLIDTVTAGDVIALAATLPSLAALRVDQRAAPDAVLTAAFATLRALPGLGSLTLHTYPSFQLPRSLARLPPSLTALNLHIHRYQFIAEHEDEYRLSVQREVLQRCSHLARLHTLELLCDDGDDEGFDGGDDSTDKFEALRGLSSLRSLSWNTNKGVKSAIGVTATLLSLSWLTELNFPSAVAKDGAAEALLSLPWLQRLSLGGLQLQGTAAAPVAVGSRRAGAGTLITRLPRQLRLGNLQLSQVPRLPLHLVGSFMCSHVTCTFEWAGSMHAVASAGPSQADASGTAAAAAAAVAAVAAAAAAATEAAVAQLSSAALALAAAEWAGTLLTLGWESLPSVPTPALLAALGQPGTRHIDSLMLQRIVLDEESLEQLAAAVPSLRSLVLSECKVQGRPWQALRGLVRLSRLGVRSTVEKPDLKEAAAFCRGISRRFLFDVEVLQGLYTVEERRQAERAMRDAGAQWGPRWIELNMNGEDVDQGEYGHIIGVFDRVCPFWWCWVCPVCHFMNCSCPTSRVFI